MTQSRSNRGIRTLLVYLLICFLTFAIGAIVLELGLIPLLAWLRGYEAYLWPTPSRIYAWCKFVPFATLVTGAGAWFIDRKRFGR